MKTSVAKKIAIIILISFFAINILNTNIVKAASLSEMMSSADEFLDRGTEKLDETALQNVSNIFYKVLLSIAIVVAIIVAMIIGIQLMLASADEKAKVKEALLPFAVSCIVVFGAFGIWSTFVEVGNDIESYTGGYSSPEEVSKAAHGIIDGTVDVTKLSNEQIRSLYSSQYVGDDLHDKTTADPRAQGKDTVMTLEEAIDDLSDYKKKIYDEAKKRGLLDENGMYIKK